MIPIESDYRRMLIEEDRHREALSYRQHGAANRRRGDGRSQRPPAGFLRQLGSAWRAASRRDAWHHT